MWARAILSSGVGVLLLGCGGGGSNLGGSVTSNAQFQTVVPLAHSAVKTAYQTQSQSNGVIVEVSCPYGTWIDAQGYADAGVTPMTPDMTFRAASITKLFTAMTVLQILSEQGITLTSQITNYLPNPNSSTTTNWTTMTIEELANHTSGLVSDPDVNPLNPPPGGLPWTTTTLIPTAEVESLPGVAYDYANINFTILAALAEKLTGESLSQSIQERFTLPLGLSNTTLTSSGATPNLGCHGFKGGNTMANDVTTQEPSWSYGAGNIVSTVGDLSKWIRAMFNGDLLSQAGKTTLLQTNSVSTSTGFGAQQYGAWWGHTGRIDGYASAAFYNPGLDATVVVVVNRWDGNSSVAPEFPILNAITKNFFPGFPIQSSNAQP